MPKIPAKRVSPKDLTPEARARYEEIRNRADKDLAAGRLGPPTEALQIDEACPAAIRAALGELKALREEAGLTIAIVAERTGIAAETLSRLENGRIANPTWNTLGAYANAIGKRLELHVA